MSKSRHLPLVENYEFTNKFLGSGGFGSVLLYRRKKGGDPRLPEEVAVKVFEK